MAFVIDTINEAKANKINMTINCDEGDIKTMEQKLRYDSLSEFKKIYESSYSWVIDKYYFMIMNNINCEKCDYRTYKYESHNMLSIFSTKSGNFSSTKKLIFISISEIPMGTSSPEALSKPLCCSIKWPKLTIDC